LDFGIKIWGFPFAVIDRGQSSAFRPQKSGMYECRFFVGIGWTMGIIQGKDRRSQGYSRFNYKFLMLNFELKLEEVRIQKG